MAVEKYAEQLERVQQMIAQVEERGQSQGVGGRQLTRADLGTLYQREKWLRKMAAREGRGGLRTRRVIPGD